VKRDRAFVTANFALTADGRISTRNLTPADFSSPRDKRRLLEVRATCDAILAGNQTVARDNMSMGLPAEDLRAARVAKGLPPYPTRVILSALGRIDPALRVFTHDFSPIIIFSTKRMKRAVRESLASKATLYLSDDAVDLAEMLRTLRRDHGIKRLVCEGGAQVFRSLLVLNLIDELHITLTPRIFGGVKAPTLTSFAGAFLPQSTQLRLVDFQPVADECFLRYRIR
jgi:riboflavin-specific deaminase-like protein